MISIILVLQALLKKKNIDHISESNIGFVVGIILLKISNFKSVEHIQINKTREIIDIF